MTNEKLEPMNTKTTSTNVNQTGQPTGKPNSQQGNNTPAKPNGQANAKGKKGQNQSLTKNDPNAARQRDRIPGKNPLMDPRVVEEITKNTLNPTLAANAREAIVKSEAVTTMCQLIKDDPKLSTDEKLDRLERVNVMEAGNKEQAHRIVSEFTWQDGLVCFLLIAEVGLFGLGMTGHLHLPKFFRV